MLAETFALLLSQLKPSNRVSGSFKGVVIGLLCGFSFDGFFSGAPGAQASDGSVTPKATLKLVTGGDYSPYTTTDKEGGGVVTHIVQRVLEHAGYDSKVSFYPWTRGYKRTLEVKDDATFPYVQTKKRSQDFLFSHVINSPHAALLVKESDRDNYPEWGSFKGRIFCQPLGHSVMPPLQEMVDKGNTERTASNTVDQCVYALARGNVDVVVGGDLVLREALWRTGGKGLEVISSPAVGRGERFMVSKRHPKGEMLINDFNKAYVDLLNQGVIKKIWDEQVGPFAKVPPLELPVQ